MTADDHMVHVSGHPARDELKRLYALVQPSYAVPVHGEWRHLSEHAALAEGLGATPILVEDGDVLRLAPGRPDVVEGVPTGRLAVDDGRLLPLKGGVLAARKRMLFNGVVVASLAVDQAGRVLGEPKVSAPGLFDGEDDIETAAPACRRPGPRGGRAAGRAAARGRRAARGGAGGAAQGGRPPAAQAADRRGAPAARLEQTRIRWNHLIGGISSIKQQARAGSVSEGERISLQRPARDARGASTNRADQQVTENMASVRISKAEGLWNQDTGANPDQVESPDRRYPSS